MLLRRLLQLAFGCLGKEVDSQTHASCQQEENDPDQVAICKAPLNANGKYASTEYWRERANAAIDGESQGIKSGENVGGGRDVIDEQLDTGCEESAT